MVESDYLDMNQLNIQCDESISVLLGSNIRLNAIREVYKAVNTGKFSGNAADNFFKHCADMVTLISTIITANDSDIIDNRTLKSFIQAGLVLDGREILTKKRRAAENEHRERDEAEECERRKHGASPEERHYWSDECRAHRQAAESYRKEKEFWESRERLFDEINGSTKSLFTDSITYRNIAKDGIESLSTDFVENKGTFNLNDSWKAGIEKLDNQVIIDKCKENWKDENGAYDLDVLKDIYKNRIKLSATEKDALTEVLEELHPEAQKQVMGHVATGEVDIKGLVQGLVKSTGAGGKIGVGGYNILTSDDKSAKRKAGLKFVKEVETITANWAATFWYNDFKTNKDKFFKANKTLYSSFKKGSFIELISKDTDELVKVSSVEVAKRSLKYDFGSYLFKNVEKAGDNAVISAIEKVDDITDEALYAARKEAETAAKLKNFKAGVKWLGVVADLAFSATDNIAEQKLARQSGIEMSTERVVAETVIETAVSVGLSSLGTAVAGAALTAIVGTSAPVVVVGALGAAAVWGVNELFKHRTGKDVGENVSDFLCDTAEAVAGFIS